MILKDSLFFVMDNSGVLKVKCLSILKKEKIVGGSLITVVFKKVIIGKKLKQGQIYTGLVMRLKKKITRFYKYYINNYNNYIIILKKNEIIPYGTRIYGPVLYEIRLKGFLKISILVPFLYQKI